MLDAKIESKPGARTRVKRYAFSGLFLPPVRWELDLLGFNIRDMEVQEGRCGTFFRNLRRFGELSDKAKSEFPERIFKVLDELGGDDLVAPFRAAKDGDPEALAKIDKMGPWECFVSGICAGRGIELPPETYLAEYVRIERESHACDLALAAQRYQDVAEMVAANPALRPFWTDAAIGRLAEATTLEGAAMPRLAACLEIQMASAARIARVLVVSNRPDRFSRMVDLDRKPGACFMDLLLKLVGAKSQTDFIEKISPHIREGERGFSTATLKRWCSGKHVPPASHIEPLLAAVACVHQTLFDHSKMELSQVSDLSRLFEHVRRVDSIVRFAEASERTRSISSLLDAESPAAWAMKSYRKWSSD